MAKWRLDIFSTIADARAKVTLGKLSQLELSASIQSLHILDTYTLEAGILDVHSIKSVAELFFNKFTQRYSLVQSFLSLEALKELTEDSHFNWLIEIGFLPGVTDNVGHTAQLTVEDFLKTKFGVGEKVYSSQLFLLEADLSSQDLQKISMALHNPLIQRSQIIHREDLLRGEALALYIPKVDLRATELYKEIDLEVNDDELLRLGREGIDSRGPLALSLDYMKTIQAHFRQLGRKPTDLELESIAQTWSEHCKHTIFADPIDDLTEGLYKTYIKGATQQIRKNKSKAHQAGLNSVGDFCVSVFSDNAGLIEFDSKYLVSHKVETHNSPSALDPFGGAITGIVGVNRDAIGCGMGAKPIANTYGFCFADPADEEPLYRDADLSEKMLSPKRILEGVVQGVNVGGNCSGIPTVHGFTYFHSRYKGKPLVFVGTLGLLPKQLNNAQASHLKKAQPGDLIVMVGGRVGQDGIHGATFSSVEMDSSSPATAVQIGDPITQKKFSDAIVKEARDLGLYSSITDNGAGGLSCSVAEMAREAGGCIVDLEKVPLKYPGLAAWKIWISESQERMTLAVPESKWVEFNELMKRRGVEATVIGRFTDSTKCEVFYEQKLKLMDLDLKFLHEGLPAQHLSTLSPTQIRPSINEAELREQLIAEVFNDDYAHSLLEILSRLNLASNEFISSQYDHEVQGSSVIKPLQGLGRVNGDHAVIRPVFESPKAILLTSALAPASSELSPYDMAAACIDAAIRAAVAGGAPLDHLALLDNFCWCSSNEPERLYQLKEAARACYDYALAYSTPYISGKDSMFNDFRGYNARGESLKISVPPTLLISALAVLDNYLLANTLDFKAAGDKIYVLGSTADEMGGSEFYALLNERNAQAETFIRGHCPKVNAQVNLEAYRFFEKAHRDGYIASAVSIARGGFAYALARSCMSSMLGATVCLDALPSSSMSLASLLYSESAGRILFSVHGDLASDFDEILKQCPSEIKLIGEVTASSNMLIKFASSDLLSLSLDHLQSSYRERFIHF